MFPLVAEQKWSELWAACEKAFGKEGTAPPVGECHTAGPTCVGANCAADHPEKEVAEKRAFERIWSMLEATFQKEIPSFLAASSKLPLTKKVRVSK